MTRDMDVSLLLTGRGAVADSPTFGRHAHASVQSGHDRAPTGGMPTVSQPYGGRMSPSHPVDTPGTLPTEQHAQHSQQVGCLWALRLLPGSWFAGFGSSWREIHRPSGPPWPSPTP